MADNKLYYRKIATIEKLIEAPSAKEFFYTGNLGEAAINNFFTAHRYKALFLELKMTKVELEESQEDKESKQQHYIYSKIQHSFITLVLLKEDINLLHSFQKEQKLLFL